MTCLFKMRKMNPPKLLANEWLSTTATKAQEKAIPLVPAPLLKGLQANVLVSGLGWAQGFLRVYRQQIHFLLLQNYILFSIYRGNFSHFKATVFWKTSSLTPQKQFGTRLLPWMWGFYWIRTLLQSVAIWFCLHHSEAQTVESLAIWEIIATQE